MELRSFIEERREERGKSPEACLPRSCSAWRSFRNLRLWRIRWGIEGGDNVDEWQRQFLEGRWVKRRRIESRDGHILKDRHKIWRGSANKLALAAAQRLARESLGVLLNPNRMSKCASSEHQGKDGQGPVFQGSG